tara:strand:+ start:99 stop:929 length:831 start_codon:yes stop_codon:yes gene_type:complete
MKTIFKLLIILISTSCFSQILEDKTTNSVFDISKMNFETVINNETISGIIYEDNVKNNRFFVLENKEKTLIIRFRDKHSIENCMGMISTKTIPWDFQINDIYYLNESLRTIKKKIKKDQFEGLNSLNLLFSSNKFGEVWVVKKYGEKKEKEMEIERGKEKEYDEKTELENYIGVYKIRITKTGSYKMNYDSFGTLIVTESGITIETEIPSIDLLRSTHDKTSLSNKPSKGSFWCKVSSKSYLDGMMVVINDSKSVGSFTTLMGKNTTTTIFRVVTE